MSTRYATVLAAGAAVGGFLFGFDTSTMNAAIIGIRTTLELSAANVGFIAAIALIGAAIGAWSCGLRSRRDGVATGSCSSPARSSLAGGRGGVSSRSSRAAGVRSGSWSGRDRRGERRGAPLRLRGLAAGHPRTARVALAVRHRHRTTARLARGVTGSRGGPGRRPPLCSSARRRGAGCSSSSRSSRRATSSSSRVLPNRRETSSVAGERRRGTSAADQDRRRLGGRASRRHPCRRSPGERATSLRSKICAALRSALRQSSGQGFCSRRSSNWSASTSSRPTQTPYGGWSGFPRARHSPSASSPSWSASPRRSWRS